MRGLDAVVSETSFGSEGPARPLLESGVTVT